MAQDNGSPGRVHSHCCLTSGPNFMLARGQLQDHGRWSRAKTTSVNAEASICSAALTVSNRRLGTTFVISLESVSDYPSWEIKEGLLFVPSRCRIQVRKPLGCFLPKSLFYASALQVRFELLRQLCAAVHSFVFCDIRANGIWLHKHRCHPSIADRTSSLFAGVCQQPGLTIGGRIAHHCPTETHSAPAMLCVRNPQARYIEADQYALVGSLVSLSRLIIS